MKKFNPCVKTITQGLSSLIPQPRRIWHFQSFFYLLFQTNDSGSGQKFRIHNTAFRNFYGSQFSSDPDPSYRYSLEVSKMCLTDPNEIESHSIRNTMVSFFYLLKAPCREVSASQGTASETVPNWWRESQSAGSRKVILRSSVESPVYYQTTPCWPTNQIGLSGTKRWAHTATQCAKALKPINHVRN